MSHKHLHTKEFAVGAAVGSLLGSVAALLTAPKSGRHLREDIADTYSDVSDKTRRLARKGKSYAKGMSCHTCDWTDKAKSFVNNAGKGIRSWVSSEDDDEENGGGAELLIGGIAGGVLGAAIGLLLAPKSGAELREDIAEAYEDAADKADEFTKHGKKFVKKARSKGEKWLNFAKHFVDELQEGGAEEGEEWVEKAKELIHNDRINEIVDWASLGFRIWKGIKSNR